MKAVILQPSYIPWRGYFHQIQKADVFVFYDDVQYDTRGWRHRNKVKTQTGTRWLSIPVHSQGVQTNNTLINQITVVGEQKWQQKHWRTLEGAYHKAPFFDRYAEKLSSHYLRREVTLLCDFTIDLTVEIAGWLGISNTKFLRSSQVGGQGAKTERLVNILQGIGATHYISGPAAKEYIEPTKFSAAGIELEYMEYTYRTYAQLYGTFDPYVTVLDLLFMTGPDAGKYIWGTPE